MEVTYVSPTPVREGVVFRVRVWLPPRRDGFAWSCDDYELRHCDLDEALDWARASSAGGQFEVSVQAGEADFYRLCGSEPQGQAVVVTVELHG